MSIIAKFWSWWTMLILLLLIRTTLDGNKQAHYHFSEWVMNYISLRTYVHKMHLPPILASVIILRMRKRSHHMMEFWDSKPSLQSSMSVSFLLYHAHGSIISILCYHQTLPSCIASMKTLAEPAVFYLTCTFRQT